MKRRILLISVVFSCLSIFSGRTFAEPPVPVDPNRVVLLSDTHIGDPADGDERKPMPVRNLKEAISKTMAMRPRPAAVLVTGDCAFLHGKESDYGMVRRLFEPLREAKIPFYFAMGNHDNREAFYKIFPEKQPASPLVEGKHVTLVSTPKADWILLDSNKETDYTPGLLGEKQLAWLKAKLANQGEKPTILLAHHNPNPKEGGSGLEDTPAFFTLIDAHPAAKAYIFGHSHFWRQNKRKSGVHLINLPTTAWTFDNTVPRGFTDAKVDDRGMAMTFHAVGTGTGKELDEKQYRFDWR